MIQSLTSGLIPFQINNSVVNINNSLDQNKSASQSIKYMLSENNSNIIITNCTLNNPEFIAYAYNNSNIFIDDNTLGTAKRNTNRFVQDDNSFINYNLPAAPPAASIEYSLYLQPLYNDGEKYISCMNNDIKSTNKNQLIYNFAAAAEKGTKIIRISPLSPSDITDQTTLSDAIADLQEKIDRIPSVLNGYTIEINLTNLSKITEDKIGISRPLIINKFYQGTIRIISDYNKQISYTIENNILSDTDFVNYLSTDPAFEKFSKLAIPLLLISEVDDCEIENLYIKLEHGKTLKDYIDRVYSILLLNQLNNLKIDQIKLNMSVQSTIYNKFDIFQKNKNLYEFNQFDKESATQYNFTCRNICKKCFR
jgi:hypothetical protein